MKNSTQLNLSVDGLHRGSLFCPRIDDIHSIDYDYDTYNKLATVDLNCESQVRSLAGVLGSVLPNIPKDSREVRVSLNYSKSVASHC